MRKNSHKCVFWTGLSVLAAVLVGCHPDNRLPAPGQTLKLSEPDTDRPYRIYVPTRYDGARDWPLVITCHGQAPWDNADNQIEIWKGLAEQRNFLIAAPKLNFPGRGLGGTGLPELQADERAVLATVKAVRAARKVEPNRIFIVGWSDGAQVALYTGLRNPDTFRAISLLQPEFDPACVQPCRPFIDRYQPIQVVYNVQELSQGRIDACIDWLRDERLYPTEYARAGLNWQEPEPIFDFFAACVRRRPMIRVGVEEDPNEPMRLRFSVRSSFDPRACRWEFGDDQESQLCEPEHLYAEQGEYVVKVFLQAANNKWHKRMVKISVPSIRLGAGAK